MSQRIVIHDASILIDFHKLGLLDQLASMPHELWIPDSIWQDELLSISPEVMMVGRSHPGFTTMEAGRTGLRNTDGDDRPELCCRGQIDGSPVPWPLLQGLTLMIGSPGGDHSQCAESGSIFLPTNGGPDRLIGFFTMDFSKCDTDCHGRLVG